MRFSNQAYWRTFTFAAAIMIMLSTHSTAQEARSFHVEAGQAVRTLKQFSKQAELSIVYDPRSVKAIRTVDVVGLMIPSDALERMLENTPLVFVQDDETGAFAVTRVAIEAEGKSSSSVPQASQSQHADSVMTTRDEKTEPKQPTLMNEKKKTIGSLFKGLLSLALASSPSLSAQDDEAEEIYTLSPFTVDSSEDTGYRANNTLAGSRLKTDFADVASSVSIVTAEFLSDVSADGYEDLLVYTTGTEVSGLGGNFSNNDSNGDIQDDLRAAAPITRVRGLAGADFARDYFGSNVPVDSYNVERVEINRGANNILFGVGSPAGIINASLKKASMSDFGELALKFDDEGSMRVAIDVNREVVEGEFAIRFAALNDKAEYQQKPAFRDDKRFYLAATYAPSWGNSDVGILSGMTVRANIEDGSVESRLPRTLPPSDTISGWFDGWEGYEVSNFQTKSTWDASQEFRKTPWEGNQGKKRWVNDPTVQSMNGHFRNPSVIFNDPSSGLPNSGLVTDSGDPILGRQGILNNLPTPEGGFDVGRFQKASDLEYALRRSGHPDFVAYDRPVISDTSIFDFRNKLIEGPNRWEWGEFQEYNLNLEQRFFEDKLGFELAYHKHKYDNGAQGFQAGNRQVEIALDVTRVLVDGEVNPNFGRPLISGNWQNWAWMREAETKRATAYYNLDFTDLASERLAGLLGKHTFTGLWTRSESAQENRVGSRYATDFSEFSQANNFFTSNNGGQVSVLYYVGDAIDQLPSAAGANIQGLSEIALIPSEGVYRWKGPGKTDVFTDTQQTFIEESARIPEYLIHSGNKIQSQIDSQAFVMQSKFLWNHIASTIGWRKDEPTSWDALNLPNAAEDPLGFGLKTVEGWDINSKVTEFDANETLSFGLVGHAPDFISDALPGIDRISLRFNESENFRAAANRVDVYNQPLAPPSGETVDYGFNLEMFDRKLYIGATWYETKQANENLANGNWARQMVRNYSRAFQAEASGTTNQIPEWEEFLAPPQYLLDFYGFDPVSGDYNSARTGMNTVTNFVSEGFELEVVYNPSENWRIMFNAAKQEATRSGSGDNFRQLFFEDIQSNGKTYAENWSDPDIAGLLYNTSAESTTIKDAIAQEILFPYSNVVLQDGGAAAELREWRVNMITNYTFSDGSALDGFSVGGALRYQDEVAIGFPLIDSPEDGSRISDVDNPYMGPSDTKYDLWVGYERPIADGKVDWSLQLNIRDLFDNDDLIPVAAQPNGLIDGYRIQNGRTYQLTSRFKF